MPATAHSDPYTIFMRKIGYSVGLEYTFKRVSELQKLYLEQKDVTVPSWANLATGEEHWNLQSDNNISDVFCALRLIQKTPGGIIILENLDAMAISDALLETEEAKLRARSFVLLWAILANDGEIFVNLLLAKFLEPEIKSILSKMIEKKRAHLLNALPGKDSFERICRTVNIEKQEKNKGSKGSSQSVRSLQRTEPLHEENALAIYRSQSHAVEFSEDYFRKVPPRRKDWARTLNLWDDQQGLTKSGEKFIDVLKSRGYIDSDGFFMFLPMDYELRRSGFRPNLLGDSRSLWTCLTDFANAFANLDIRKPSGKDPDRVFKLLKTMINTFRKLHVRKSMLRRELPITVAYPAAVALAIGEGLSVIDFPAALIAEQEGDQRRISMRKSRHTGHALNVRK